MPVFFFSFAKREGIETLTLTKKFKNTSDKTVKIINIDVCQFENSFKRTRFQLVMIRNNRANFSFASYLRKPHMASLSS